MFIVLVGCGPPVSTDSSAEVGAVELEPGSTSGNPVPSAANTIQERVNAYSTEVGELGRTMTDVMEAVPACMDSSGNLVVNPQTLYGVAQARVTTESALESWRGRSPAAGVGLIMPSRSARATWGAISVPSRGLHRH